MPTKQSLKITIWVLNWHKFQYEHVVLPFLLGDSWALKESLLNHEGVQPCQRVHRLSSHKILTWKAIQCLIFSITADLFFWSYDTELFLQCMKWTVNLAPVLWFCAILWLPSAYINCFCSCRVLCCNIKNTIAAPLCLPLPLICLIFFSFWISKNSQITDFHLFLSLRINPAPKKSMSMMHIFRHPNLQFRG